MTRDLTRLAFGKHTKSQTKLSGGSDHRYGSRMTITLELDASSTDPHTRRALTDISLSVAKCKRIVVVTGAGISCSCGIPVWLSSPLLDG